jgi:hypothetical protein
MEGGGPCPVVFFIRMVVVRRLFAAIEADEAKKENEKEISKIKKEQTFLGSRFRSRELVETASV